MKSAHTIAKPAPTLAKSARISALDTRALLIALGIHAFLLIGLLTGCGRREPSGSVIPGELTGDGAPLAPQRADPGILTDQSKYKPSDLGLRGGSEARRPGAASGDAIGQVQEAVRNFKQAANEPDLFRALAMFDPAHLEGIGGAEGATAEKINATFEKIGVLRNNAQTKLGDDKAAAILAAVPTRQTEDPQIDALDENSLNVKSDIAIVLFGKERGAGGLRATRVENEWKFQLGAPLAATDVEPITAYHDALQKAVDDLTTAIEGDVLKDEKQIRDLLAEAIAGNAITIPAAGEAAPAPGETPAPGEAGGDNGAAANDNAPAENDNAPENDNAGEGEGEREGEREGREP